MQPWFFSLLQPWPRDFAFKKWHEKPSAEVVLFYSSLSFSSLLEFSFLLLRQCDFRPYHRTQKKLPFCPFPINWQANVSQFVFENPAGYKLHYRRNTTGDPGSKCLSRLQLFHKEVSICVVFLLLSVSAL